MYFALLFGDLIAKIMFLCNSIYSVNKRWTIH